MRPLICMTCICATAWLPAVAATGSKSEARFWTDNTGSFTVEAAVADLDRSTHTVTLRLKDQTEVDVPLRRLSREDLVWLQSHFKPQSTEIKGVTWFTSFKDAKAAAAGSEKPSDDKPIMCFRALGELTGFM